MNRLTGTLSPERFFEDGEYVSAKQINLLNLLDRVTRSSGFIKVTCTTRGPLVVQVTLINPLDLVREAPEKVCMFC